MKIVTLVYDEDVAYCKAAAGEIHNTSNAVIACCDGDAMEERDAYKAALEKYGISPEITLKVYRLTQKEKEPTGS